MCVRWSCSEGLFLHEWRVLVDKGRGGGGGGSNHFHYCRLLRWPKFLPGNCWVRRLMFDKHNSGRNRTSFYRNTINERYARFVVTWWPKFSIATTAGSCHSALCLTSRSTGCCCSVGFAFRSTQTEICKPIKMGTVRVCPSWQLGPTRTVSIHEAVLSTTAALQSSHRKNQPQRQVNSFS